jgi:ABC-type lipoprotein export system ATPase subunit
MSRIISVKNLRKVYKTACKELEVLKDITFDVEKAQVVSVTGPSGAGKSTLLHIIGGLDLPTQGEVLLNGKNVYTIGENAIARLRNKDIGFVFQFYHLLENFTALENIAMPCIIKGERRIDALKKAEEIMEYIGLLDRAKHKPSELSGGEQQRIAIARAVMNNPAVLLCDEPTGNLHTDAAEIIWALLKSLNMRFGTTIIFATHDISFAKRANRLIYLKDGLMEKDSR